MGANSPRRFFKILNIFFLGADLKVLDLKCEANFKYFIHFPFSGFKSLRGEYVAATKRVFEF